MYTSTHSYHDESETLEGFLAFDATNKNPRPAVLVAPDWTGCNDFARDKARLLAEMGYVGFAIDMYGRGVNGRNNEEKTALITPLMEDRASLQKRIRAAFDTAASMPEVDNTRIAAIGFCFGGLCVLDLARSGAKVKGVVSFHGLLRKPDNLSNPNTQITAKVLALHGYDDPMVSPEEVQAFCEEMTKARVDWQVHQYGQTMHGFTNPTANDPSFGTVYSPVAERRSMQAMKDFLEEIL